MFAPAKQAGLNLNIPGISHDFNVLTFEGIEHICQPSRLEHNADNHLQVFGDTDGKGVF